MCSCVAGACGHSDPTAVITVGQAARYGVASSCARLQWPTLGLFYTVVVCTPTAPWCPHRTPPWRPHVFCITVKRMCTLVHSGLIMFCMASKQVAIHSEAIVCSCIWWQECHLECHYGTNEARRPQWCEEATRKQGSTHSVVRRLADTTVAVMLHVFPLWVHQMTKQQAKKN